MPRPSHRRPLEPAETFPPGEFLLDELRARGISQARFAKMIGTTPKQVQRLIHAEQALTVRMAVRFEDALGISAITWLALEAQYRVPLARKNDHGERPGPGRPRRPE